MSEDPLDWLRREAVKRILNQNRWDEARYLTILYACSRLRPWEAKPFSGFQGFLRAVLRDLADELGYKFEFYRGARRMLEERLERDLGYVRTFRGTDNFTYYAITPEGSRIAESALGEAIKLAQGLETMFLPAALFDRFKQDLQRRARERLVDPDVVRELVAEYESLDALSYSSEATEKSKPRAVKLSRSNLTIGRSVENTLSFPDDRYMSRKHALVECVGTDHWIRDLASKNGTWRIGQDGKRVRVEREKVDSNAIYEIGTTRLMFSR